MFIHLFHQDHCLICHEVIDTPIGWVDLFSGEKEEVICHNCRIKLVKIEGEICQICSRPLGHLESKFRIGDICYDCHRWETDSEYNGILTRNFSFYLYNEFLKELIAKFKFRGDYILAKLFAEEIKAKIKELKPDQIVPIPLSEERLQERGFNQAEALIVEAGLKPDKILTRTHSEKQSKKSRSERIHLSQVFQGNTEAKRKIIIIDDIYTTGSTLRHAGKALKASGAETVIAITMARG